MNNRQKAVYSLIKQNSLNGRKTSQKEICSSYSIENFEDGYVYNTSSNAHDRCVAIWSDIQSINFNEEVNEIIITKNFEYWIAENEEDARELANFYRKGGLRKLKRYWQIISKLNRNGQGFFTINQLELDFYNAFLNEQ